jgi:mannosyltransferase
VADRPQAGSPRPSLLRGTERLSYLGVVATLLVAFVLRIHQLDAQSLWGDEMWSHQHTSYRSVEAVLQSVRRDGAHPPLYYLALYPWKGIAGQSEFAIRYPSVLFGTLAVAAIYALGCRLGGVGVGLIAALLHALSPIHVYYSQEARMYSLMILLVTLSSYFFWRLLRAAEAYPLWTWVGYVLSSALAINTHLFAIPVLVPQAVMWIGQQLWNRRVVWAVALRCAVGQAATLLLFLPWLACAWERATELSAGVQRMGVDLELILRRCLNDFSAGLPVLATDVDDLPLELLFPFLLTAALGLIWPWRRRTVAFLGLSIVLIVAGVYYVSFPAWRGWTKFFLAASPFYHLLLARGADGLGRLATGLPVRRARMGRALLPALTILPLVAVQARSLHAYYTDPLYARWDYRGQMEELVADAQEGAAVILQGRSLVFEYYFPSDLSYLTVPSECGQDEAATFQEIAHVAATYETIWLVRAGPTPCDPNLRAEQWLRENAYRVEETWLEDSLFGLYLTPRTMGDYSELAGAEQATFEGLFQLESYALHPGQPAPGDELAVALRWRALARMETDFKFFLVLLGPDGTAHAQRDGMPLNWLWPTTRWAVGEPFEDRWGLALPANAPSGTYSLHVGAYEPSTGHRLCVQTEEGTTLGDMILVATVQVW